MDRHGFECWCFCPGMLFNSPEKWWGDHGRRDFPHEGIDLCLYRDHSRRLRRIDETTRIPAIHDGVVKARLKDFLGQTLIIEHERTDGGSGGFLSLYGHTNPQAGIEVDAVVKAGDIIATLGDTGHLKSGIIPHLHLSFGIPSKDFSYDRFVWNTIRNPELITLLDPQAVIDWPCQELNAEESVCCTL